ncbi:MAG: hypothetical protein NTY12_02730 [Candidatus Falkowbacteria bacterium]|nr:hypothetical protein [Candidatus Falkowbacteria bacterium]
MPKVSLDELLEEMFGISEITDKKDLEKIVAKLRENPDQVINFQKFAKSKRNN